MTERERSDLGVITPGIVAIVMILAAAWISLAVIDKDKNETIIAPTVAVDTEYAIEGKITVYNGKEFLHFDHVVDYEDGDPGNMYPYSTDVVASFVTVSEQSGESKYYVVLPSGEIAHVETYLRRIPLATTGEYKVFETGSGDKVSAQHELNDTFTLIVSHDGKVDRMIHNVVDYKVAYDTLYFMDSHDAGKNNRDGNLVWQLNWLDPEPKISVYCGNAYGVSPHTDEAEGALVSYSQANYSAYGRNDIYSPYGVKP